MRILWGFGTLLFLVVGCSVPGPAPEPGRGDGVILLVDWLPGLLSMSDMDDPPDFVLYGNGLAVAREEPGSGVLKLVEYHLTPQRVRALFSAAADADLFDGEDYSTDAQVADGGSLVIMLRTETREHRIKVPLPDPDDCCARGKAAEFAKSLQPSRWAASDFSTPPASYQASRVAVTYMITTPTRNEKDVPRPWPLPETEPIQDRCVVITGATAAQAPELGETAPWWTTLWQREDTTFHAWVRPLLPDETDCHSSKRRYLEG
jgi:hypothetical protein